MLFDDVNIIVTYALLEKIARGKASSPGIVRAWWEHQYPVLDMHLPIYFMLMDGNKYRMVWDYERHTIMCQKARTVNTTEWVKI